MANNPGTSVQTRAIRNLIASTNWFSPQSLSKPSQVAYDTSRQRKFRTINVLLLSKNLIIYLKHGGDFFTKFLNVLRVRNVTGVSESTKEKSVTFEQEQWR